MTRITTTIITILLTVTAGCIDEAEDCGPWGCDGGEDDGYTPPDKAPCPYDDRPIWYDGGCTMECETHQECRYWGELGVSAGCYYAPGLDLDVCRYEGDA